MLFKNKILNFKNIKQFKNKFKKNKIVLCHGVFDLLHIGHINYFKSAKKLGDILVVSITNDKFVNKGPGRPAFSMENRIKFLKEISCIDFIYPSNDLTAEKIIKNLKPNFYCKGSDYSNTSTNRDVNLKKEIKVTKQGKGKFKIIKQPSFSSSKFINDYSLQNFNEECKNYISTIRKNYDLNRVTQSLEDIKKKKILIIGETIIDKYISTEAIGKSGKEPMLVIKPKKQTNFLGGSAYIANLTSSFSDKVKLLSFLGDKKTEKQFVKSNLKNNISHNFLTKKNSTTISKLRYIDDYRKTKIIGVYDLNDELISKQEEKKFFNLLKKNIKNHDLIIVADYGHGIITKKISDLIVKNSNKIYLNTQINSFNRGYHTVFKYKKINTLVINESEIRYELRDKNSEILKLASNLRKKISINNLVITRGKKGAVLIDKKNKVVSCPAFNQNNKDTIGAGDTFFGICSLAIGSKIDPKISMLFASIAANFSIDQIGRGSIFNYQMLKKYLNHILK